MITYELAKELKDAGFPFNQFSQEDMDDGLYVRHGIELGGNTFHVPTLSELTEACGEKFTFLEKGAFTAFGDHTWRAYWEGPNSSGGFESSNGLGNSPEEAVARLWLALNKKV